MSDRPPLLSIHLTSNRPEHFVTFLDRLQQSTDDAGAVEVVVKIDDTDARMNELLAAETARRPFRITCISTPLAGGFYELWRSYDELLRISHPEAYFVVGLNDEMYFAEKGWDTRLRKYVGLYPDHIFRLRTSIHRERNTFDYWEASCAGDLTPIMTKRWLDVSGGWCPCNGPDSFQNAVAYYFGWLYRHDTFTRPYRERVVHDIEFGGYGANHGFSDRAALRRRVRGSVPAWFILMSHETQQEAARRAQRLHAHIAAAARRLQDYEVVDDARRRLIAVVDRRNGARVWQGRYAISRWRIRTTNFIRTFNYSYYGGGGEPVRYGRRANLVYYVLLRHEWLERLHAWASRVAAAAKRQAALLIPFSRFQQMYARLRLAEADTAIRRGDWEAARTVLKDARAVFPADGGEWLKEAQVRLHALQGRMAASPDAGTRLGLLLRHQRRPSSASCAAALQFAPAEAERLRVALLRCTIDGTLNPWVLLPVMDIRRVALFGGDAWGVALQRQLEAAGVTCVAVIDNNPALRDAGAIAAPYFSQAEYVVDGPKADAVLGVMHGDHDRILLADLQDQLGAATPVLSWKMIFSVLLEETVPDMQTSDQGMMVNARS
jgi:hypothetical protein